MSSSDYMLYKNPYQGSYRKVLFVCSAGILRSPTAAHWAAANKAWNTRSAGCLYGGEAGIPVSVELLAWADHVYVMENEHLAAIRQDFGPLDEAKFTVLGIRDIYEYRNKELVSLIEEKLANE